MAGMSREEHRELLIEAVNMAFDRMGLDTANPREMQQDMAFLRRYRHRADSISNRLFMWFFVLMVTGGSLASWKDAIADAFKGQ
jgi:hypothetical protein